MIGYDVKIKPIKGKDAKFFWDAVKKSGKPTRKAIEKLKARKVI